MYFIAQRPKFGHTRIFVRLLSCWPAMQAHALFKCITFARDQPLNTYLRKGGGDFVKHIEAGFAEPPFGVDYVVHYCWLYPKRFSKCCPTHMQQLNEVLNALVNTTFGGINSVHSDSRRRWCGKYSFLLRVAEGLAAIALSSLHGLL